MNSKNEKVALLIIDPQNDFCSPKGTLHVLGAEADNERLALWMLKNKGEIDQVVVTLDSHHVLDISHPKFWVGKDGKSPDPFTIITAKDVLDGVWKSTVKLFGENREYVYLEELEKQGEFPHCIWPEHCLVGSWGQAVDTVINGALREWVLGGSNARYVSYVSKGAHPMTEYFGAFRPQVSIDGSPESINIQLIETLNKYDVIYLAGQAKSHCVANSLKQIMELSMPVAKKFVVLEDTMSNVSGYEHIADSIYERAKNEGIRFTTTTEESL
jgi:nicotinamidase-related amidase